MGAGTSARRRRTGAAQPSHECKEDSDDQDDADGGPSGRGGEAALSLSRRFRALAVPRRSAWWVSRSRTRSCVTSADNCFA